MSEVVLEQKRNQNKEAQKRLLPRGSENGEYNPSWLSTCRYFERLKAGVLKGFVVT